MLKKGDTLMSLRKESGKIKSEVTFVYARHSDIKGEIIGIFRSSRDVVTVAKDKAVVMIVKASLSNGGLE